jgi:hypothetical protein
MKRLHVHLGVVDLEKSIRFHSARFAAEPSARHADYAKWQLEEIGPRLAQADVAVLPQKNASCCYAKSDKYWTLDPQGIAWESFHTLDTIPVFGADTASQVKAGQKGACCAPPLREPA